MRRSRLSSRPSRQSGRRTSRSRSARSPLSTRSGTHGRTSVAGSWRALSHKQPSSRPSSRQKNRRTRSAEVAPAAMRNSLTRTRNVQAVSTMATVWLAPDCARVANVAVSATSASSTTRRIMGAMSPTTTGWIVPGHARAAREAVEAVMRDSSSRTPTLIWMLRHLARMQAGSSGRAQGRRATVCAAAATRRSSTRKRMRSAPTLWPTTTDWGARVPARPPKQEVATTPKSFLTILTRISAQMASHHSPMRSEWSGRAPARQSGTAPPAARPGETPKSSLTTRNQRSAQMASLRARTRRGWSARAPRRPARIGRAPRGSSTILSLRKPVQMALPRARTRHAWSAHAPKRRSGVAATAPSGPPRNSSIPRRTQPSLPRRALPHSMRRAWSVLAAARPKLA
mmetsp:Transcript_7183/g.20393  ORF Transcript_7183/g.20393 Transcript_7183/m.20393 type:complete len:399 (-) Transcript_7183:1209-2405(-)